MEISLKAAHSNTIDRYLDAALIQRNCRLKITLLDKGYRAETKTEGEADKLRDVFRDSEERRNARHDAQREQGDIAFPHPHGTAERPWSLVGSSNAVQDASGY